MSFTRRLSKRDEEMARTKYAGRESATERADRQRREERAANVREADRAGAAWEDEDRRRNG